MLTRSLLRVAVHAQSDVEPGWDPEAELKSPLLETLITFFATQIDQPQIVWSPRARQRTVFALCFTTSHNIISRRRQKDKTNLTGGLVSSLEGVQVQHHCPFSRHKGLFSGAAYFSKESSEKWSKLNPFSCNFSVEFHMQQGCRFDSLSRDFPVCMLSLCHFSLGTSASSHSPEKCASG